MEVKQKKIGIDLLKIIALCGVVGLHTQRSLVLHELWNPYLYYLSRFCMPVFFMVNGALIMNRESYSFDYYKRKMINILRVLSIWAFVSFLYSLLLLNVDLQTSFLNGIKCWIGAFIIPFWFFFTFGIIYTVLLFAFKPIKDYVKPIVLVLFLVCMLFDVLSVISISRGGYFIQQSFPQKYRLWTWFFYFLLGHYLMNNLNSVNNQKFSIVKKTTIMVFLSIIAWIYQYFLCYKYIGKMNSEYCYDNVLIILWSISIFILFANFQIKNIRSRNIILLISSNMFGVFLLHGYFLKYFGLCELVSNGFESTIMFVALITVCWSLSYCLSYIPIVGNCIKY